MEDNKNLELTPEDIILKIKSNKKVFEVRTLDFFDEPAMVFVIKLHYWSALKCLNSSKALKDLKMELEKYLLEVPKELKTKLIIEL